MPPDEVPKPAGTKPAMPAQPATIQLPAMTTEAMIADIYKMSKGTAEDVKIIRADQDLLMGTVDSLKVDVRDLQRWKIDTEDRQSKHSGGVRQLSTNDAKQDAELANERAAREALALDVTAIKTDLKTNTKATVDTKAVVVAAATSFMKRNPRLEYAIVGFILAVLSTGISLLSSLVHK